MQERAPSLPCPRLSCPCSVWRAAEYMGLPWVEPSLNTTASKVQGVNFAVAGAGSLNTTQLTVSSQVADCE